MAIMLGNIHHLSLIQGFEVEMYLRAVQIDVQQKKLCCSLHIATNILWQEVKINRLTVKLKHNNLNKVVRA